MPTNKYDKQTTFIGIKDDLRRRLRLEANPPRSDGIWHNPAGICRNLIKNRGGKQRRKQL